MPSLWDEVAGTADHYAGSTDEAFGRAVDDAADGDLAGVGDHATGDVDNAFEQTWRGIGEGRLYYAGESDAGALDGMMGSTDEWFSQGPVDDAIDYTFSGHAGDTIDAPGPELTDPVGLAEDITEGTATAAETAAQAGGLASKYPRLALGTVAVAGGLYLFGPALSAGAELAGN